MWNDRTNTGLNERITEAENTLVYQMNERSTEAQNTLVYQMFKV